MKQYITLEEAKMQIPGFVDYGEQDEYITGCILDAQPHLKPACNLLYQNMRMSRDVFPEI